MSRASESGVRNDLRRHVHIRIGQDDDGILRSALRLHAFAMRGGGGVNIFCDIGRADERHRANGRVFEDRIHHILCAVDEIDHALRKTNLLDEFHNELHRHRNFFRRLDDVRVARRERIRQIPKRNHAREVERRDRGAHPNGLTDHQLVYACGDVFDELALHHHRHPARHFDIFVRAHHLGFCLFERLARFVRDEPADLIRVLVHQIPQLE